MMRYLRSAIPCHSGPVEVIPNLFCGSLDEVSDMVRAPIRADTLIPLYTLEAEIWELGFRGEILYYPIDDFGVLPDDVLNEAAAKILDRLKHGKKVGLFCMGGHGRTGYVASVVLGKLGYKDPIKFLRSKYCSEAVESDAQIQHIAKVLGKPELVKKYKRQSGIAETYRLADRHNYYSRCIDSFLRKTEKFTCGDCTHFITGACHAPVCEDDKTCECFESR